MLITERGLLLKHRDSIVELNHSGSLDLRQCFDLKTFLEVRLDERLISTAGGDVLVTDLTLKIFHITILFKLNAAAIDALKVPKDRCAICVPLRFAFHACRDMLSDTQVLETDRTAVGFAPFEDEIFCSFLGDIRQTLLHEVGVGPLQRKHLCQNFLLKNIESPLGNRSKTLLNQIRIWFLWWFINNLKLIILRICW